MSRIPVFSPRLTKDLPLTDDEKRRSKQARGLKSQVKNNPEPTMPEAKKIQGIKERSEPVKTHTMQRAGSNKIVLNKKVATNKPATLTIDGMLDKRLHRMKTESAIMLGRKSSGAEASSTTSLTSPSTETRENSINKDARLKLKLNPKECKTVKEPKKDASIENRLLMAKMSKYGGLILKRKNVATPPETKRLTLDQMMDKSLRRMKTESSINIDHNRGNDENSMPQDKESSREYLSRAKSKSLRIKNIRIPETDEETEREFEAQGHRVLPAHNLPHSGIRFIKSKKKTVPLFIPSITYTSAEQTGNFGYKDSPV